MCEYFNINVRWDPVHLTLCFHSCSPWEGSREVSAPVLGYSILVAWILLLLLDTQIHLQENSSDLPYPGVSNVTSAHAAWNSLWDTKPSLVLHQELLCSFSWNTNFGHCLSSIFGGISGGHSPCFSPVYMNNLAPLSNIMLNNQLLTLYANWKATRLIALATFTHGQTKKECALCQNCTPMANT